MRPRLVAKGETPLATSDYSVSVTLPIKWRYLNSRPVDVGRQLGLNYRFRATGAETESKIFHGSIGKKKLKGSIKNIFPATTNRFRFWRIITFSNKIKIAG